MYVGIKIKRYKKAKFKKDPIFKNKKDKIPLKN